VVYLHTSFRETPEGGGGREWRAGEILGRGEGVGGGMQEREAEKKEIERADASNLHWEETLSKLMQDTEHRRNTKCTSHPSLKLPQ